ncbi:hypothetical protein ACFQ0G_51450 [Streptomyces chiangmaiensis]
MAHLPLRYAVEDISIAGVTIRRSDPILNSYAAACEDPDKYGPTAGDFDITRSDKDHLAFDHGVHFCLGAPPARLQAEVALPALFDRSPGSRRPSGRRRWSPCGHSSPTAIALFPLFSPESACRPCPRRR